jgi:hypothetical protein
MYAGKTGCITVPGAPTRMVYTSNVNLLKGVIYGLMYLQHRFKNYVIQNGQQKLSVGVRFLVFWTVFFGRQSVVLNPSGLNYLLL